MNYNVPYSLVSLVERKRWNPIEKYIDKNSKRFIKKIKKLYKEDKISDKLFLRLMYRFRIGRWPNFRTPKTFTEKQQWLKLYYRLPMLSDIVDKVKFKDWARAKIGDEYIIPTIGVWDSPEEIEFDKLPPTFVLKCNHSSGYHYIHSNPDSPVDKKKIIDTLNKRFNIRWDKNSGEWPYKHVERKVIAENFLSDLSRAELPDYKFFCFNGEPRFVQMFSWHDGHSVFDADNKPLEYNAMYDMNWNKMPFITGYPYNNEVDFVKPKNFDKMVELAKKLSEGFPYVKVDFYNINGKIYVGELTFYPYGGFGYILPDDEWDYKLGEMVKLPSKKVRERKSK